MTKTVLVPVDFTELGLLDKVVSHLKALSVANKLNIHFLSVIPSYESFVGFAFAGQDRLASDKQRIEIALSTLKENLSHIDIPNSTTQFYVSIGNPRDKILETAKKIQAELIVIGSRNPGMKTYLLGSTASSVVSYAESSVLVVR
ncbi:universal stress protein [Proteus terrae]|uniref:universal stress protein n=1 Tax=Proteus TaxID=583 RepID=UPI0020349929|nr:universal stress protein [Proteus sp. FZP2095]MCM2365879.1 universal stress protein [Proteus sp. FZP2095]